MPSPRRWFLPLIAGAFVLMAASAEAGKPPRALEPLPRGTIRAIQGSEAAQAGESCVLGDAGPASQTLNFIFFNDQYYTLLEVADCVDCAGANAASVSGAHVQIYFPVACSLFVKVYLVGVVSDQGCTYFPDYTSPPLTTPVLDTLTSATDVTLTDFEISFPRAVVERRAFLCIDMVSFTGPGIADENAKPRLMLSDNSCQPCRQYNDFSDQNGPIPEDMCYLLDPVGWVVMYANIDSCFVYVDSDPPARITNLQAASITSDEVNLTWTAPGDDGYVGRASYYEIRHATFLLDSLNFTSGDSLTGIPSPQPPGYVEYFLAGGLQDSTTHYFAIRAWDEAGNPGAISNVVAATTGYGAPGRVLDLAATDPREDRITLGWSATADEDSPLGRPTRYIIAVSTEPLDNATFNGVRHDTLIASAPPGQPEFVFIEDLEPATNYWFAVKAQDEVANLSAISNVATQRTLTSGPLAGRNGVAIASRVQPARLPVDLYWQSGSAAVPSHQMIHIFDTFGRKIRVLRLGGEFSGIQQWDGRDEDGRLVPSGVYIARLTSNSATAQTRVVLLR